MSLVQNIFLEPVDIVGDVHGEYDALMALLYHLGYNSNGIHPKGRKLVFVGDLCDRGPNSPAVIHFVNKLIQNGLALSILGNHELNLLQNNSKDGAGWYFDDRKYSDHQYAPFVLAGKTEKTEIYDILKNLPLALERDDLRIVHSTWRKDEIELVKKLKLGEASKQFMDYEQQINDEISLSGLLHHYHLEQEKWSKEQSNPDYKNIPFLEHTAEYNVIHQMRNPMRVLTSGIERRCENPFFASGKWRFVERFPWWDEYEEKKPVIVGHFWRKIMFSDLFHHSEEVDVFHQIEPFSWHGKNKNVFCIDFSVGGRFKERISGKPIGKITKLAAMRWPEKTIVFDTGEVVNSYGFNT